MSKLTEELQLVKDEVVEMCRLTYTQLSKSLSALINFDKDLAREVVMVEKRVNSAELKIDRDCEDIFAIYSPVAVDLRFLLAVLKINTNLERIGDIADGIVRLILDTDHPFSQELLDQTKVVEMFGEALHIVEEIMTAFEREDSAIARGIFKRDEFLDNVNRNANNLIIGFLNGHPGETHQALNVLSIIRKLERVGDHAENIAEEIIFFIEAKVLRHVSKKER
jgi:phosphate transport system protein